MQSDLMIYHLTVIVIVFLHGQNALGITTPFSTSKRTLSTFTFGCPKFIQFNDSLALGGILSPLTGTADACKDLCATTPSCFGAGHSRSDCFIFFNPIFPTIFSPGDVLFVLDGSCTSGPSTTTTPFSTSKRTLSTNIFGCPRFVRFDDTAATGSKFAVGIRTEEECKEFCANILFCLGVWIDELQDCFYFFETIGTKFFSRGDTLFVLDSSCIATGTTTTTTPFSTPKSSLSTNIFGCPRFDRFQSTSATGIKFNVGFRTEDNCKAVCADIPSCLGILIDVFQDCFYYLTIESKFFSSGDTLFVLDKPCIITDTTTTSTTQTTPSDSCPRFIAYPNRHSVNGDLISSGITEEVCKSSCTLDADCVGVDFGFRGCYISRNTVIDLEFLFGNTFFGIDRRCFGTSTSRRSSTTQTTRTTRTTPGTLRRCPRFFPDRNRHAANGTLISTDIDEPTCKLYCVIDVECVGVDFGFRGCYIIKTRPVVLDFLFGNTFFEIDRRCSGTSSTTASTTTRSTMFDEISSSPPSSSSTTSRSTESTTTTPPFPPGGVDSCNSCTNKRFPEIYCNAKETCRKSNSACSITMNMGNGLPRWTKGCKTTQRCRKGASTFVNNVVCTRNCKRCDYCCLYDGCNGDRTAVLEAKICCGQCPEKTCVPVVATSTFTCV